MRAAWLRLEKLRQFLAVETTHSSQPQQLHQRLARELALAPPELSPFQQLKAKAAAAAANPKS